MKILRVNENNFKAIDDNRREIGSCRICRRDLSRVFPDCPIHYFMDVQCEPEAEDLLYSAGLTRGRQLTKTDGRCGVYVRVPAERRELVQSLREQGLKSRDGLRRMVREVTAEPVRCVLPRGCTIVRDRLENSIEFTNCLNRYNECFGTRNSENWLKNIAARPDFTRSVIVAEDGLCGELLAWRSGDRGVIGVVQTARQWRQKGIATYLLEDARMYFTRLGLACMTMEVRCMAPGSMELATAAGFVNDRVLYYYLEL